MGKFFPKATAIYLDQFAVSALCDDYENKTEPWVTISKLLKKGVSKGTIVCPYSVEHLIVVVLNGTVFLRNFDYHRKFDKAFKSEALRMIDEGQSVAQVAKSLNISDQLLHTWKHAHKKQTQKQAGNTELPAENERLKRAEMDRTAEAARHIKKKHSDLHSTELKAMYRFIQDQSQYFPVLVFCQTMEVNRSGYYEWLKLAATSSTKDTESARIKVDNAQQIKDLFGLHRRRYGSRRLVSEMKDRGVKISRDFVRRVLVENQLRPIQPRSFVPRTTDSRPTMGYSPNLLLDRPRPTGPNQVWPVRRCGFRHHRSGGPSTYPWLTANGCIWQLG